MTRDERFKDRHAIKAAIHRADSTLKAIATTAGLEPSACKVALHRPHPAGERAIAAFFGVEPSTIWPGRYLSTKPVSDSGSIAESRPASSPIGGEL